MAVEITGKYLGDLTSEAIHTQSGSALKTTAPLDNGGLGDAFSPTDLLATSLATCMLTIMGIWAKNHAISIEGTSFRIEKHMSEDAPRRVSYLPVTFDVKGAVPAERRPAFEAAAHKCPVKQSLAANVRVEITFNYLG